MLSIVNKKTLVLGMNIGITAITIFGSSSTPETILEMNGTDGLFIVDPDGQRQISGTQSFSVFKQILDHMI